MTLAQWSCRSGSSARVAMAALATPRTGTRAVAVTRCPSAWVTSTLTGRLWLGVADGQVTAVYPLVGETGRQVPADHR